MPSNRPAAILRAPSASSSTGLETPRAIRTPSATETARPSKARNKISALEPKIRRQFLVERSLQKRDGPFPFPSEAGRDNSKRSRRPHGDRQSVLPVAQPCATARATVAAVFRRRWWRKRSVALKNVISRSVYVLISRAKSSSMRNPGQSHAIRIGREQRRDRHGIEFIAKTNKRVSALSCFRLIDQSWERKWNTVQVRLVSIEKEFLLEGCD